MSSSSEEIPKELMAEDDANKAASRETDLAALLYGQLIVVEIVPQGNGMHHINSKKDDISIIRLESSKIVMSWTLPTLDCYAILERLLQTHDVLSSGRSSHLGRESNSASPTTGLSTWFILERVNGCTACGVNP